MIGIFSKGMMRIPHIELFLDEKIVYQPRSAKNLTALAGWGWKPTSLRPRQLANQWGLQYLAVEDGFLRSLGLGIQGSPPLSLVVDDTGIYYDSTRPSSIERIINESNFSEAQRSRSASVMQALRRYRLSKYNHAPELQAPFPYDNLPRVLVVDQTFNDVSVALGNADESTFQTMLTSALHDNPGAHIAIKVHPDVLCGKKKGYLPVHKLENTLVLHSDCNPIKLLEQVDIVYTVSSQLGFEALLMGKEVHCFGLPFYAGWGLTKDRQSCPRRRARPLVEDLFHAAYISYPRYIDPFQCQRCEIETVVEILADQKRHNDRNRGVWVCAGFSPWRKGFATYFLRSTEGSVHFARKSTQAVRKANKLGGKVLVWAPKSPPNVDSLCKQGGIPLVHMEDGFLRSSGLGSDFYWPYSISMDTQGIYYDPSTPSDMETLLETTSFPGTLLERARRLQTTIVDKQVTKYNVGTFSATIPAKAEKTPIVLVVGQVENDASILKGSTSCRTDLELLRAVRERRPDAYIVYKPHPDVVCCNRKGLPIEHGAVDFFDQRIDNVSLAALFPFIQELHTITSLSGFEALLRNIEVHTYGAPFYAGWGLTHDMVSFPRRSRRLKLEELIAGALLVYPSYFDWQTELFCGPEVVLQRLVTNVPPRQGAVRRAYSRFVQTLEKKFLHLARGQTE